MFHAESGKSTVQFSWTHYRIILQESDKDTRDWYEQVTANEMWSTRTCKKSSSCSKQQQISQKKNE
ncbi:MAG: hypothetical protein J6I49_04330 [Bacteroidales bacterium]|nr:hypothetical protein [Bacteroidales bacterium]